jgi:hypothetical protein
MISGVRRVAMAVLLLVGVFVIGAVPGAAATMHAQRHEQTTTVAGETTTVAPTTIAPATTEVPTTTETPTTTEPATEPATTSSTTSSTTSTTVPPPATSSGSSSTPWGWIIAILAVIAVVLIVVLAVRRRSSSRAESEWKNAAASALRDANLTRDMLAGEAPSGDAEAATRLTAVRDAVERVASHFDQLATSSPNDEMRRNSIGVATSLRGYYFAVESEQMLHDAPTTPTADQLATADAAKRAGAAELDAAVAAIRAYVAPA